jgi:hypothetical protein
MNPPDLKKLEQDWEINARVDPMLAIANWPGKRINDVSHWTLVPQRGQAFLHFPLLVETGEVDTRPRRRARFASIRLGLHRVLRALGREKWALKIWNPTTVTVISHQRLIDFAKSVGLSYLRTVVIPALDNGGRTPRGCDVPTVP